MTEEDEDKTVVLGGAAAAQASAAKPVAESSHNALPVGTLLGEFELIGLVGEGGFGIVYLAQDHSLERKVALKEYMPASLASRAGDATVSVRSERHRETFEIGRRSFVNEARLLAQFDHPALVKVYRFWEANGTAYMAMPYYDGRTLRDVLRARGGLPDESWIRKVLAPVIDALELIHREKCFHRDVAPDNIMLLRDDRPVLLDFGAARRVIGDMTQALTVILKPGYAPIEQYAEMPGMQQGPWTDVYALAAVIHFMITGRTPPPSVGRMMQDSYQPLAQLVAGKYSDTFLRGVDRCLSVKAEDRPQDMAQMRELLGWSLDSPLFATTAAPTNEAATRIVAAPDPLPASSGTSGTGRPALYAIGGAVLVATLGVGYWWLSREPVAPPPSVAEVQPATPSPAAVVTPPALPRPPAPTLAAAFQSVVDFAAPDMAPTLEVPASVVAGTDHLTLKLESRVSGHLYLLLWDTGDDRVYRLFPNDADVDSLIGAGNNFHIPRSHLRMPWTYPAQHPVGEWRVLAVVSEQARDFSTSLLRQDGDLLSASRADLETGLAGGASIAALLGEPKCTPDAACSGRFGVAAAVVTETLPVPVQAPVVAPRPAAQATPTPRPRAQAQPVAPPVRERPAAANKGDDATAAEREYMQQLNKDLDRLLQGQ